MLAARLCQVTLTNSFPKTVPALKTAVGFRTAYLVKSSPLANSNGIRHFADTTRGRISHAFRRQALQQEALAPAGEGAFNVGKAAVAGGAVVGLGALCYYGLGMSSQLGAVEKSMVWPQYVKDRIKSTYMYFGGSILISVASAAAVFSTPSILQLFTRGGFVPLVVTMGSMIGALMLVQNIPYSPGFGAKQLAWIGHSALLGAVLAPMAFLGGPVLVRAAWYTAGVVGGLSAIAVCAPSEKFLQMGGPLAIGLGFVFASSIGSMFLPPTTALGAGLHSFALYGGLLLFSGLLLYDTQKIIQAAEKHPPEYTGVRPYDPVNMSLSVYLDFVNIFIRIASILAFGGGNKKR